MGKIKAQGELSTIPALCAAMDEVLDSQAENSPSPAASPATSRKSGPPTALSKTRAGKRPYALIEQPRYRAAYDFLVLRAEVRRNRRRTRRLVDDVPEADGEGTRHHGARPDKAGDKTPPPAPRNPAANDASPTSE